MCPTSDREHSAMMYDLMNVRSTSTFGAAYQGLFLWVDISTLEPDVMG